LIDEFDGGLRLAGGGIVDDDIEAGNFPILSLDEWIAIEVRGLVPPCGVFLVFVDQRRERQFEKAPQRGLAVEGNTVSAWISTPIHSVDMSIHAMSRFETEVPRRTCVT
jgi:hypothetical protein